MELSQKTILAKTALLKLYSVLEGAIEPVQGERSWFSFVERLLFIDRERFYGVVEGAKKLLHLELDGSFKMLVVLVFDCDVPCIAASKGEEVVTRDGNQKVAISDRDVIPYESLSGFDHLEPRGNSSLHNLELKDPSSRVINKNST